MGIIYIFTFLNFKKLKSTCVIIHIIITNTAKQNDKYFKKRLLRVNKTELKSTSFLGKI